MLSAQVIQSWKVHLISIGVLDQELFLPTVRSGFANPEFGSGVGGQGDGHKSSKVFGVGASAGAVPFALDEAGAVYVPCDDVGGALGTSHACGGPAVGR